MSGSTDVSTANRAAVNTRKVAGRRKLRFESLDEILVDAEQLAARPVRQLGNWSLGQATGHLAGAMQLSLDGFKDPPIPLPFRLVLKLLKKRLLEKGFQPGFRLRGQAAKTIILEPTISCDQGMAELRANIARLKSEPQRHYHPAFGVLTREEWDLIHLRHAELHLSFFVLD